jgi:hypothetical protein
MERGDKYPIRDVTIYLGGYILHILYHDLHTGDLLELIPLAAGIHSYLVQGDRLSTKNVKDYH